jgi:pimeloyl-ACP methyl ester carboxylesterase
MTITNHFINYRGNPLYYVKSGNGLPALLLFHGFGQTQLAFQSWNDSLTEKYTLYSFDLFFHGESKWNERKAVEKGDWKNIIELFLEQESISKFSVGGFSMGGKFAMATVEAFPDRINKLILLAPDGIKTSFWYSLATYPIAIRALFKSMILHPNRLYRITKFLRTLRLIDKGLLRFAELQMDTEEKRRRVYYSWVYFRHLKVAVQKIGSIINDFEIGFTLVVGKHDKVIPAKNMDRLLQSVKHYRFEIIDAGHNDLIVKVIQANLVAND